MVAQNSKQKQVASVLHVKKGDTVKVLAGKDKGKVAEIIQTFPKHNKVSVKGVNIKTKHTKPTQQGETGRILQVEKPIDVSNVMLYSNNSKIASRISYTYNSEGKKLRILKKTQEYMD